MLEAVLQHEKTSAWVVPHWVWGVPMLHEQSTRNWLGWREFSGSPCRLCLYTWQGVCWDCAKSGISALPCLAHIHPYTPTPNFWKSLNTTICNLSNTAFPDWLGKIHLCSFFKKHLGFYFPSTFLRMVLSPFRCTTIYPFPTVTLLYRVCVWSLLALHP